MPDEQSQAPEPIVPTFAFDGFAVESLIFKHLDLATKDEGEEKPTPVPADLGVGGHLQIAANTKAALLRLDFRIVPDPKWQPYEIELSIVGQFSSANSSPQDFDSFCRVSAPGILFPYVREIVHRITRDGRFGAHRLQPVNLQAMLSWVRRDSTQDSEAPSA